MASWDVRCEASRGNKQLLGQSSFLALSSGRVRDESRHSRSDRFRSRHDIEMHGDGSVTV